MKTESEQKETFQILFQDEYYIAINKPNDYMVHRSPIAKDATKIVLQELRDQIGKYLYPVHRLDRKTSGVLIFGLTHEATQQLGILFRNHTLRKYYRAIVRGWTDDEGLIDYPLINEQNKSQSALTSYVTLERSEITLKNGLFETARYSHVGVLPKTGRSHQIRKHLAHIFHPIIGDRPHGCNKQNKIWKETFQMTSMMLHAQSLGFVHPITDEKVEIYAPYFSEYNRVMEILNLKP